MVHRDSATNVGVSFHGIYKLRAGRLGRGLRDWVWDPDAHVTMEVTRFPHWRVFCARWILMKVPEKRVVVPPTYNEHITLRLSTQCQQNMNIRAVDHPGWAGDADHPQKAFAPSSTTPWARDTSMCLSSNGDLGAKGDRAVTEKLWRVFILSRDSDLFYSRWKSPGEDLQCMLSSIPNTFPKAAFCGCRDAWLTLKSRLRSRGQGLAEAEPVLGPGL